MNSLTFPVVAQVFSGGHMMIRRYYSINNLFQSVCYFFFLNMRALEKKEEKKKAVQQLLICLETSVDKFAPLGIPKAYSQLIYFFPLAIQNINIISVVRKLESPQKDTFF